MKLYQSSNHPVFFKLGSTERNIPTIQQHCRGRTYSNTGYFGASTPTTKSATEALMRLWLQEETSFVLIKEIKFILFYFTRSIHKFEKSHLETVAAKCNYNFTLLFKWTSSCSDIWQCNKFSEPSCQSTHSQEGVSDRGDLNGTMKASLGAKQSQQTGLPCRSAVFLFCRMWRNRKGKAKSTKDEQ
jgi:hypothetical protein